MTKLFEKMDVEIASERDLANGETKVGNGTLRKDLNKFIFQECLTRTRRKNPLIYQGRHFRARSCQDGTLRLTAVVQKRDLAALVTTDGMLSLTEDLRNAIDKFKIYL